MPSITPVISAILRATPWMSPIVATTRCTAAPPVVAALDAPVASALACAA
ncbi:putative methyl-accepting chemotaxis protein [Burkholderia mallei]|nr:putative methyl-accepting chemotaxis protein [Burkholderia mallei]